jgi:hypothetical protein
MNRRRLFILMFCISAGCSTHPLVDLCDTVKPAKLGPNKVQPYGGVAIPQGPIVPVAPAVVVGPPAVVPGGAVVPPPAPLPGARPPGLQLQPPIGDGPPPFPPFPPPPPAPPGRP